MEILNWRKSTHSHAADGKCVELARVPGTRQIATRDSKQPSGPQLRFAVTALSGFLAEVKRGEYDL